LGASNTLAHQYHIDRAMIEQVQEDFAQQLAITKTDAASTKSADTLRRLLTFEDNLNRGPRSGAVEIRAHSALTTTETPPDSDRTLTIYFPYFGTIHIASHSDSGTPVTPQSSPMTMENGTQLLMRHSDFASAAVISETGQGDSISRPPGLTGSSSTEGSNSVIVDTNPDCHSTYDTTDNAQRLSPRGPFRTDSIRDLDFLIHHSGEGGEMEWHCMDDQPGLTAGVEDWTMQGVDVAFFETLMHH
jgi:hypothetical protein